VKLCPEFPRQKRHLTTEDPFHHHIGLKLRKRPVKFYVWNTVFVGVETWTLRKVDQKYVERFEMCCWRRIEKIFGKIV